jgi:hypothetical protein
MGFDREELRSTQSHAERQTVIARVLTIIIVASMMLHIKDCSQFVNIIKTQKIISLLIQLEFKKVGFIKSN